ncbi:MAG: Ser/Thr protein phosphatase [Candidatus Improbicoccus devescovinae]|nr:MAG: Ser/Thr protein phosphatase [Candidatus Improbicoccus devescovinae]
MNNNNDLFRCKDGLIYPICETKEDLKKLSKISEITIDFSKDFKDENGSGGKATGFSQENYEKLQGWQGLSSLKTMTIKNIDSDTLLMHFKANTLTPSKFGRSLSNILDQLKQAILKNNNTDIEKNYKSLESFVPSQWKWINPIHLIIQGKGEYYWIPAEAKIKSKNNSQMELLFKEQIPTYSELKIPSPDEEEKARIEIEAKYKKFLKIFKDIPAEGVIRKDVDSNGGKVAVFGDLHGDLISTRGIVKEAVKIIIDGGQVVFCGDYIDRGPNNLDVLELVFGLKTKYPKYVTLLRGNHEVAAQNSRYGFAAQCEKILGKKFGTLVWKAANLIFDLKLAYCAVINKKQFVAHGGLPNVDNEAELFEGTNNTDLPKLFGQDNSDIFDTYTSEMVVAGLSDSKETADRFLSHNNKPDNVNMMFDDLMWSDPMSRSAHRYQDSNRRCGHLYGPKQINGFLGRHGFTQIVRAHQVNDEKRAYVTGVLTVFSSAGYSERYCALKDDKKAIAIQQDLISNGKGYIGDLAIINPDTNEITPMKYTTAQINAFGQNEDTTELSQAGITTQEPIPEHKFEFKITADLKTKLLDLYKKALEISKSACVLPTSIMTTEEKKRQKNNKEDSELNKKRPARVLNKYMHAAKMYLDTAGIRIPK